MRHLTFVRQRTSSFGRPSGRPSTMFLSKSSSLRLSMTSTTSVSAGGRTAEFLKAHVSVTVVAGQNLAAKDKGGTSDPYVVLAIDDCTAKTTCKKKTLSPEWNEEFSFNLSAPTGKIHLTVWDKDRFSSDDFMGQADLYLDPTQSKKIDQWVTMEQRKPDEFVSGEIRIIVLYEVLLAEITLDDFEIVSLIGEGSFGKVYQVKKKDTGHIYAMKALKKKMLLDEDEVEHTKAERDILISNNHPFLINMKFSFQNETRIFFVLDYVNGGELFYHLKRMKRFTEEMIRFYAAEITLLLMHLHTLGIIYRDLKPENILIEDSGHVKLTDFGLSKMASTKGRLVRATTFCGTPEYLAPEVLARQEYGTEVDWWCLGNLLFEMLTGFPPFHEKDTNRMYEKIKTSDVRFPPHTSNELRDLINKLLDKDPDSRLMGEDVKKHPFFQSINWTKILQKRVKPPFIPKVSSESDLSNVDSMYISQTTEIRIDAKDMLSASLDANFEGFGFVREVEVRGGTKED